MNELIKTYTMNELIKTYKETGKFTHEQKCEFFIKPTLDVLKTIAESDDFNFRKECLISIIDFNGNIDKEFLKNKVIIETLKLIK
jgi:hypothetical protein